MKLSPPPLPPIAQNSAPCYNLTKMVNFDSEVVERLSLSQKRRILLEGRELFVVLALIIFLLGVMIAFDGEVSWGLWFIVFAIFIIFLSASRIIFMRPAKQKIFITNRLLEKAIRESERQTGEIVTTAERDSLRFQYDPAFHAAIEKRASKNVLRDHQAKLNRLTVELKSFEQLREAELKRLESLRWQQACSPALVYSLSDGQIRLNHNLVRKFSDLDHLQLILHTGTRTVKRFSRVGLQKHCAATYQKARNKVDQAVDKRIEDPKVEEILPEAAPVETPSLPPLIATYPVSTCEYLAVRIYFKDHTTTEIILLPTAVDWRKKRCQRAYHTAWQLMRELEILQRTPLPEQIVPSTKDPAILQLDQQILTAKERLEQAKQDTPTYEIPARYLTPKPDTDPSDNPATFVIPGSTDSDYLPAEESDEKPADCRKTEKDVK